MVDYLATKVIEFETEKLKFKATVATATILIGMKRSMLKNDMRKIIGPEKPFLDLSDEDYVRLFIYPDIIVATVEFEGKYMDGEVWKSFEWPMSFETFLTLPEAPAAQWQNAIYELNPHWLPAPENTSEQKKKEKNS
jgi:hypothetical protein